MWKVTIKFAGDRKLMNYFDTIKEAHEWVSSVDVPNISYVKYKFRKEQE